MKHTYSIFGLLLLTAFYYNCSGCKENPCRDGYDYEKGECQCPEGSFEAYGLCRPPQTGEYVGYTKECTCDNQRAFFTVGDKQYDQQTDLTRVYITKIFGNPDNRHVATLKIS
jgi:hypothetical protein